MYRIFTDDNVTRSVQLSVQNVQQADTDVQLGAQEEFCTDLIIHRTKESIKTDSVTFREFFLKSIYHHDKQCFSLLNLSSPRGKSTRVVIRISSLKLLKQHN